MLQGGIKIPKGSSLQEQQQISAHPSIQATQVPGTPPQQYVRSAFVLMNRSGGTFSIHHVAQVLRSPSTIHWHLHIAQVS